jgi:CTP:molybdopterin cytidylyltransferase MocA/SAM-dependent methyltransferase
MSQPVRFGAVVLAAGAGSRFGGGKLLAPLDGRPILGHVLDAIRAAGLTHTVVVLGHGAEAIEAAIPRAAEQRVVNPNPDAGLSSSLRVGFDAIETEDLLGVFVVLGDQPLVDPAVFDALRRAEVRQGVAFVVPRYIGGGSPNPVLVLRDGWRHVADADGDRGFGPILAAHPELVAEVELGGSNPDVDTAADLAELAWANRVRRNRDQVDRHREVADGPDFYGPVTGLFRADPRRNDEPLLDALRALAGPDDVWLDIGAGAGRYALPLALRVREVLAVEPSEGMRAALIELMDQHGIVNVRVLAERWPPEPDSSGAALRADVALIANVGYDIEPIGPFIDAMEAAASRRCVAVLMERQPSSIVDPFWPPIHGEERVALPALPEFVDLLRARGRQPEVTLYDRPPRSFDSLDELHGFVRRQLWLTEGGRKDGLLQTLLQGAALETAGRWSLPSGPAGIGLVSWAPADAAATARTSDGSYLLSGAARAQRNGRNLVDASHWPGLSSLDDPAHRRIRQPHFLVLLVRRQPRVDIQPA